MKNPLFEKSHPFTKLVFFFFLVFVSFVFVILFSLIFNSESITTSKLLIAIQHLFVFIIPAILAAYIFSTSPTKYLHFNNTKIFMFVLAAIIIFFAVPLINYTGMLNSKLSFPESMSGLENTLKSLEETAQKTTIEFLSVKSYPGLIINLLIIAVIPAIGEELFFRGILLNLFKDWTKNIHIAIIITSVLFSTMHLQFYGFLPRMLLGILFAYLLVWSGSIWLPILAHFLNNAVAVIIYFFMKDTEMLEKTDSFGADKATYVYLLFSVVILVIFMYFFRKAGKELKNVNP